MILTCPECGTRYVVKDGAIPSGGRQVRCASCKHSWHQDPEAADPTEEAPAARSGEQAGAEDFPAPEPMTHPAGEPGGKPAEARLSDHAHPDMPVDAGEQLVDPDAHPLPEPTSTTPQASSLVEPEPVRDFQGAQFQADVGSSASVDATAAQPGYAEPIPTGEPANWSGTRDEDYSPYPVRESEEQPRRRRPLALLVLLLLIAALAAAFWFLAPTEWKQRVGVAQAGETPLLLQLQQQGRQELASGNQLLEVSGMVINPTNETQRVPPIRAQLRSLDQQVVYTWTIPPPARTLAPGGSASFNSAELNIPPSAQCIDLSFSEPKPASKLPACKPGLGSTEAPRNS